VIRSQVERLRRSVAERLEIDLDELVLGFEGPSYWFWVLAAAIVAILLFVVSGIGGAVGGAIVWITVGSWFFFVDPYVVGTTADEVVVVEMSQPVLGGQKAERLSDRRPREAGAVRKQGRRLHCGERELQLMPFWAGQAEAVVASAEG
jgi:hypothetical protein